MKDIIVEYLETILEVVTVSIFTGCFVKIVDMILKSSL